MILNITSSHVKLPIRSLLKIYHANQLFLLTFIVNQPATFLIYFFIDKPL